MKNLLLVIIIVAFVSCTNGDGVCCPRTEKKVKELFVKNDTITAKDFYDTDTIIYVIAKR